MGSASVLLGTDRVNKDFAFSDANANVGVFAVRHSKAAFDILEQWWNVPADYDKTWLWRWPPEQGAFHYCVRPKWSNQHIRVIPYFYMNGSDGVFIRHLMGVSNYNRLKILRAEAKRLILHNGNGFV